ncbi:MAG: hypothetical protein HY843_03915 [Bdellovibrio sp.]|nr:hypothetical protein [Bdellovibrio sp.]
MVAGKLIRIISLKKCLFNLSIAILTGTCVITQSLASEELRTVRIPCGPGFLRACDESDRANLQATTKREPAVIKKFTDEITHYFTKQYIPFLYNDGIDAENNKITFPDGGRRVDLSSGESTFYSQTVCSRCSKAYDKYKFESKENYKNTPCGPSTDVYVASSGQIFIRPGKDAKAWYDGILPILIDNKMNEVLERAKTNKTIAYAKGCQSMALKMEQLVNESKELSEKILNLSKDQKISEDDFKKVILKEKDIDDFLALSETKNDNKLALKINTPLAQKNAMTEKLRQLVLLLRSIIYRIETVATRVAICSIHYDAEMEFKRKFGNWAEFYNKELVGLVGNRIEYKVGKSCGSCKTMGTCHKCVNKVANEVTPIEIEKYFDERIAPYCKPIANLLLK